MDTWDEKRKLGPKETVAVSPKLDGVRAEVTKKGIFTRNGNPITTQPGLNLRLKPYFLIHPKAKLEGELTAPGKPFEDTLAAIRPDGHPSRLRLNLFPGQSHTPLPILGIRNISEQKVTGQKALNKVYSKFLKGGNEGAVIRTPTGDFKRKPVHDAEYTVVDAQAGTKHGSFTLKDKSGNTFKAQGSAQMANDADKIKGKSATVRYNLTSQRGVPRAGVVKAIRDYDMSALSQGARRVIALSAAGIVVADNLRKKNEEEDPAAPAKDAVKDVATDGITEIIAKGAIKTAKKGWLAQVLGFAPAAPPLAALDMSPRARRIIEFISSGNADGGESKESWWQQNKFKVLGSAVAVPALFAALRRFSPPKTGFTARPGTPGAAKLAAATQDAKFERDVARRQKAYSSSERQRRAAVDREARRRVQSDKDFLASDKRAFTSLDDGMIDENRIPAVGGNIDGDEVTTVDRTQQGYVNITLKSGKTKNYQVRPKIQPDAQDTNDDGTPVQMSALSRLILFNDQSAAYGQRFGPSDHPLAAFRKAKRLLPAVRRAGEVSQDLADVAQGREKRAGQKRFWEKSWFHNAILAGAIAAPIAAVRIHARQVADREGHAFVPLSSRLANLISLDIHSAVAGWDVRDARGRSARVFAPGSQKRDRRDKTPWEKTDTIRKERNLALIAGIAGLGSTAYLLMKGRAKRPLKVGELPEKVVPFQPVKTG